MMAIMADNTALCLGDLLVDLVDDVEDHILALPLRGLQIDSRKVTAGDVFIACAGARVDGRAFIEQAVAQGATAVLVEQDEQWCSHRTQGLCPVLVVANLPRYLSEIANRFYRRPSSELAVLGVTGTNGKTSCTQMFMQLLNLMQQSCGVMGTLGTGLNGVMSHNANTTPDALTVQHLLAHWRDKDLDAVAMEVSSHGLVMGRVAAVDFTVALFTNLSRDHLDFHGDMTAYGDAKAQLFQQPGLQFAVLNADDTFSPLLAQRIAPSVTCLRYSVSDCNADVYLTELKWSSTGVHANLHSPWGCAEIQSPLLGQFNLSNLLAVITALCALDYELALLVAAIPALQAVAGRLEPVVVTGADIDVVVDYAHTPDALSSVLHAMREHCQGRLWCIFGCGGDRDKGKRPLMGEIVEQLADVSIVTSDNPRSESMVDIAADITAGMSSDLAANNIIVELDRAKAIAYAIAEASAGDVIVIAGKGHEGYQQIAAETLPFNDSHQARLAMMARRDV